MVFKFMDEFFEIKCHLLAHGCALDTQCSLPENILHKEIHLYSDSEQKPNKKIPEDFFIGTGDNRFISRLRLNSSSPLKIGQSGQTFFVKKNNEVLAEIEFLPSPKFRFNTCKGVPISSICTLLGNDTLGVVPSNYCFYFKDGKQCRFCEILPTHKKEVAFSSSLKAVDLIAECLGSALESDPYIKHIGLITGNIKSYDWTIQYFCQIGQALQEANILSRIEHFNATIMPPEDFSLIDKMRAAGFNKIYFPIEVYNYETFKVMCPGKTEFGFERILDALSYAVDIFGVGNVYTNLVYGVQSLNSELDPSSYHPEKENALCLEALYGLLDKNIIPGFTIYHYGGYNSIGRINLDTQALIAFFKQWGQAVFESQLVNQQLDSPLYGRWSFSNTLINDGFWLAKKSGSKTAKVSE